MNYLFMGSSDMKNLKYALANKDDLTSRTSLMSHAQTDIDVAADSLSRWIAACCFIGWLVSDKTAHFPHL